MVSVVAYDPTTRAFTAEDPPAGTAEPELSIEALRLRVRQQELLADFGVLALKGTPFPQLLHEAACIVAQGLKAEFAKVLKYIPAEKRFLVCAGIGWDPGVVGVATIGADTASPAGYALQTGKAVISNHLDIEAMDALSTALQQFQGGVLMVSHDVTMLQTVCTSLWVCDNGTVEKFPGDVQAYKKRITAQANEAGVVQAH